MGVKCVVLQNDEDGCNSTKIPQGGRLCAFDISGNEKSLRVHVPGLFCLAMCNIGRITFYCLSVFILLLDLLCSFFFLFCSIQPYILFKKLKKKTHVFILINKTPFHRFYVRYISCRFCFMAIFN